MNRKELSSQYLKLEKRLVADCPKCMGLCCIALCHMKDDGFPADKKAGKPCRELNPDFTCAIYHQLLARNMKGCLAYDCLGAGQKATRICFPEGVLQTTSKNADAVFGVFLNVFKLHQCLFYLLEALSLAQDKGLMLDIESLIHENEGLTGQDMVGFLGRGIDEYLTKVNFVLKKVSKIVAPHPAPGNHGKDFIGRDFKDTNLGGWDFAMALMIAANLDGCSFEGTNFLGADMRDANISNADLSGSLFLTQMQVNSAKGNSRTLLPGRLSRPISWQCK